MPTTNDLMTALLASALTAAAGGCAEEFSQAENTYTGVAVVSQGTGDPIGNLSLTDQCPNNPRFVAGPSGTVSADDGTTRTVPMSVHQGRGAVDMYNDCGEGDNPNYLDELDTVIVDEGGEIVTAHLFADNYYELYVNGKFIARDRINFVPFNSTAVRFQASYPMTIAVHLADWETHPGIGLEYERYHVGDAGFIASFDNDAVTDSDWKVLPVYIAPLDDPACVKEDQHGNADASSCPIRPDCADGNPELCRALHYAIPAGWIEQDYDDSHWQQASLYEADAVTSAPGYAKYADRFDSAEFIWSASLKLDNQVLARYVIKSPTPSRPTQVIE